MLDDVVKKFHWYIFEDHAYVSLGGNNRIQLYNVGMAEQLQILYLSFNAPSHVSTYQLAPVYGFHCYLLTSALVSHKLDFSKRSLPNVANKGILIESIHGPNCTGRSCYVGMAVDSDWGRY